MIKKTVEFLEKRARAKEKRRSGLGREKELKTLFSEYLEAGNAQTTCLFCGKVQGKEHICSNLYLEEEIEKEQSSSSSENSSNDSKRSYSDHEED